jgi:hypothetical protein
MKSLIGALLILVACSPAVAQYDCATVRAYVQSVGVAVARQQALAQGMTAAQEREARKCFASPAYPAGRDYSSRLSGGPVSQAPHSMRRFFVYRLWPRRKRSEERIHG